MATQTKTRTKTPAKTAAKRTPTKKTSPGGRKPMLDHMKTEVAHELGFTNYQNMDKGSLTARQNGLIGGHMTKKLVEMASRQLAGKSR